MLIDIKPIYNEFNDCVEGQVNSIVESCYKRNYLISQIPRWCFELDVNQLNLNSLKDFLEIDYHMYCNLESIGLTCTTIQCNDFEEYVSGLRKELKNQTPVIIVIHITYCPWDPNYGIPFDRDHAIIVNGYNEDKKEFICCDAYYKLKNVVLPMDNLKKGANLYYIKINEVDRDEPQISIMSALENHTKNLLSQSESDFEKIRKIARYLEQWEFINNNPKQIDEVLFSKTYMTIRDVAKNRGYLAYILNTLNDNEKAGHIAKLFTLASKRWLTIRGIYVRMCITADNGNKATKLENKLLEIATLEESIAKYIINDDYECIASYLNETQDKKRKNSIKNIQTECIDLSEFYNNNGFGSYNTNHNATFSVSNEFFLTPEIKPNRINIENLKFKFPNIEDNIADNIICNGQEIQIKRKNVLKISFLGTAEFTNNNEKITIQYASGTRDEIDIVFPEWYSEQTTSNCVALETKVIARKDESISVTSMSGKIFVKEIEPDNLSMITSIFLPDNSSIHIFSISLTIQK